MTLQNRAQLRSMPFNLTTSQMESVVELVELKPHRNAFIEANSQQLVVIDGAAWVTMNGEDYVVKAGDFCVLAPGKDRFPVCVSPLGGKPVTYALK
ncbi:MAG: hypothetical protein BroJett018_08570 [Chloroflexota bacterium]|nr:hypothetical protein [Chloroflexota bacterium]NOG62728.1 hypothetical protein [Chloroflexota bacterium]GIK63063.1 MAG: hypothetical protein BroJett018_08570 [Chloroflexota bacterium]